MMESNIVVLNESASDILMPSEKRQFSVRAHYMPPGLDLFRCIDRYVLKP